MKRDKYDSRKIEKDKKIKTPKREISFFITEDCNLNCSYCYLPRKNDKHSMSFEVARKGLDYFLSNPGLFPEPKAILDFIGGEPLLEIDLIDQIVDYFKIVTYKNKHRWFNNYRISMTSNGTLCKSQKFERFLLKNIKNFHIAISLDGIKEKHDLSRKYKTSGKGSYDDVIESVLFLKQITPNINIKATFSSDDLKYLKDSVIHLFNLKKDTKLYANVVYENVWKEGDDKIYEAQLIELADYLIDNDLYEDIEISFFNEFRILGRPYHRSQLEGHWCNSGHQVSIAPDGMFYPCNRFHPIAMVNQTCRTIGNVDDGIDFDKLRPFRVLTLEKCSNSTCIQCDVAMGCGMCSGLSYDDSETGTIFNRTEYNCLMHKSRIRANDYYWNRLAKEKKFTGNKTNYYITQIQNPKKILNVMLSSESVQVCGYKRGAFKQEMIEPDVLNEYIERSKEKNYFLNFIYPPFQLEEQYLRLMNSVESQVTIPYTRQTDKYKLEDGIVFVITAGQELDSNFSCVNVILLTKITDIAGLSDYVKRLFKQNITRVNLVFELEDISIEFDFSEYKDQLNIIAGELFEYIKSNQPRYVNVITDIFLLNEMNNCNAGINNITLGPDGRSYICPAFYYSGMPVEGTDFSVPAGLKELLDFKKAFVCKACDAFHCRRCVFDNYNRTAEFNIPGEVQCVMSHVEREVSMSLQNRLMKELNFITFKNILTEKDYIDPFTVVKIW